MPGKILIALSQRGSKIFYFCGEPLPCKLRSGGFLEPGKPADLWECSLEFSKNSEVFLVGKTTLLINSCVHYLLGLSHLKQSAAVSIYQGVR